MLAQTLPAGQVITQVPCLNDSNHHYALFLPSYFYTSDEESWPVIYAFDAAARGSVPVELFRDAAEKYGYIIAGSNISENGPWELILKAAENMMTDVQSRFPVDSARRYTAGFSGGARVATTLAVLYGTFEGVIGCGAGFSANYPPHFDLQFSYIGLIGDRDLNYLEMKRLDEKLAHFRIDHYIYEFPGGHEWPPVEAITDAVTWLEFRAMKNDLIWIDYNLREDFYGHYSTLTEELMQEGRNYDALIQCRKLLAYLEGIRRLEDMEALAFVLNKKEDVTAEIAEFEKALEEERTLYAAYNEAFSSYKKNFEDSMTPLSTISWWKDQVKKANLKIERNKSRADALLGFRILDYLWRTSYMHYQNIQGTEYWILSRYYLEIWALAQPEAVSPYFYQAKFFARQGRPSKAIESLQQAVDRGLHERWIVDSDPDLIGITTLPEFERIARKLEN